MQQDHSVRTFVLASVGVSLALWNFAFNWAAYSTIFFEHIFVVWIVSVAVLLANFWLPAGQRPLRGKGVWALCLPTLWLVVSIISQFSGELMGWLVFGLGTLVMLVCLPYVAFVILSITQEAAVRLPQRLRIGVLGIGVVAGALGYTLGSNHYLLLSCEDFKRSGNYVPENCWDSSK